MRAGANPWYCSTMAVIGLVLLISAILAFNHLNNDAWGPLLVLGALTLRHGGSGLRFYFKNRRREEICT